MNKTKLKHRLVIFIIVLLTTSYPLTAKEYTPHAVTFGGDVNGNIYFADFNQLGNIENCCTSFGNTFDIGYNLHIGYEYIFPTNLFGMPWRLDLSFAYSDLSATFLEKEEFANIIIGNSYTKGVAEFELKPSVQAIMFDPGIFFNPISDIPLSIRLGFQIGFLTAATFSQEERLISPGDIFYENGTRVRGQYSGTIPNAETQYFAVSFGLRYRLLNFGDFSLYPSLRFNYGLNNLVQNKDWKASAVQGGITLAYNVPKSEAPAPVSPPMPPLPEPTKPPAPSKLEIYVNTELDGKDGDDFELPYITYASECDYYLLPYIFFAENSDRPLLSHSTKGQNIGEVEAQDNLLNAVAGCWKQNPEYFVTLLSSSLSIEDENIVDSRISRITNELIARGMDISKIKVKKFKVQEKDINRPELKTENIFIKVELSDKKELIQYSITQTVRQEFVNENVLSIKPNIKTSDKLTVFEGKIFANKSLLKQFGEDGTTVTLASFMPGLIKQETEPIILSIDVFAKNSAGAKFNAKKNVKLTPIEERINTEHNIYNSEGKDYSQYILCYFDFDNDKPKIINHDVLNLVKKAIEDGKNIVLLPLTDNIGEQDYNKKLAKKRTDAALKLLDGRGSNCSVLYPEGYVFTNATPSGRMLNRTIVVRIEN